MKEKKGKKKKREYEYINYKRLNIPSHSVILQEQAENRDSYEGPIVEQNGKLSIVILSCQRLKLLKRTCKSLFAHIDQHESDVELECIIVDNGSGKALRRYVDSLDRFDQKIYNRENQGIDGGLNQGFAVATGEFVFQLEDDWICNVDKPFFGTIIEALREFDDIGLVRLKQTEFTRKTSRNRGEKRHTSSGIEVEPWFPTGQPCGAYCFGCGVFKRQSFLYTGPIPAGLKPRTIEHAYARMFEQYYNGARIEGLLEAFSHIGDKHATTGWKDF